MSQQIMQKIQQNVITMLQSRGYNTNLLKIVENKLLIPKKMIVCCILSPQLKPNQLKHELEQIK